MRFWLTMIFLLGAVQAQAQMLGASLISTSTGGAISATYGNFNYISATSGIVAADLRIVAPSPVIVVQDSAHTSGTAAAIAYLDIRDSAGNEYGWLGDGSVGSNDIGLYASAGNVNLGAGGQTLLTLVSATGNVGIGTTTPNTNLHVVNNKSGSSYTAKFDSYNGSALAYMATNTIGLYASSSASSGYGVYGYTTTICGLSLKLISGRTHSGLPKNMKRPPGGGLLSIDHHRAMAKMSSAMPKSDKRHPGEQARQKRSAAAAEIVPQQAEDGRAAQVEQAIPPPDAGAALHHEDQSADKNKNGNDKSAFPVISEHASY